MLPMQQPLLLLVPVLLFSVVASSWPALAAAADEGAATYIVYLNPALKPSPYATHLNWHHAHLDSLSLEPSRHLLYSYTTANGRARRTARYGDARARGGGHFIEQLRGRSGSGGVCKGVAGERASARRLRHR
jgi:hypothetical protein